jgi:hypothetical protein
MRELGVMDATIKKDGTVFEANLELANLAILKQLAAGKHEYKITSASVSLTNFTRQGNDGELTMSLHPKRWVPASAGAMKNDGASYRYVSSPPWGVSLSSSGEWTNVANSGAFCFVAGTGLEKDTRVSLLVRGNVQFR